MTDRKSIFIRGIQAFVLCLLIEVVTWLIYILAFIQFAWQIVTEKKNGQVALLGDTLAGWLRGATQFVSGAHDEKPFPWSNL